MNIPSILKSEKLKLKEPNENPKGLKFTFQFRKLDSGPFQGLWELKEIEREGKEVLLFDANTLNECIAAIGMRFEAEGL